MKTQLATTGRQHPPHQPPTPVVEARPTRRVGPIDRAALHLGMALVKWGRRPVRLDPREQAARYAETHEARLERERLHAEHLAQSVNLFR